MQLNLTKKPKNATLIIGFPGIGLVGNITTNYLVENLKTEKIGSILFDEVDPIIAIHKEKLLDQATLYYNEKKNIVILNFVMKIKNNLSWILSNAIIDIAKKIDAKEVIGIEGVNSVSTQKRLMFYTNKESIKNKLKGLAEPMKEGIIFGPIGALMFKIKKPLLCLFGETHVNLPDTEAAEKVINFLNKYKKLNIDEKTIKKQAKEFHEKISKLIQQTKEVEEEQNKKEKEDVSYFG